MVGETVGERVHEGAGVSVVIATRDRPELLRRAVEAALGQDFDGPIEVIVVFDQAEPDHSLERLTDPDGRTRRVWVTRNVHTPGLPGARNSGIALATHPWIAFCDDDDLWLPAKLRAQAACLADTDTRACVTGIRVHYGDRVRPRSHTGPVIRHADLVRDRVTAAHPSTYLVHRDVVAAAGPVDEEIPGGYAEDYDWLLRVTRHTDIGCVAEPMVEVLWHQGSYFTRRWETIHEALDYLLARHPDLAEDRRGAARIHGQQAFALAALDRRREGWRQVRLTVAGHPGERRALAAAAVLSGVVSADRVLAAAHRTGRGI